MGKSQFFFVLILFFSFASFANPATDAAQASTMKAAVAAMTGCWPAEPCAKAVTAASTMCLESLSPDIKTGVGIATAIMPAIQMVGGSKLQCSNIGTALKGIQAAMLAYTAACGAAQAYCSSTCSTALQAEGAEDVNCSLKAHNGIVKAIELCGSYKANLGMGAVGLAAMVLQMKQAKGCEEATNSETDCTKNPTAAGCVVTTLDCKLEANATNPTCICAKNPRAIGCVGGGGGNTPTPTGGVGITIPKNGGDDPPPNFAGGGDGAPVVPAGSGGGGATTGGLPGGGGGGMGTGGASQAAKGSDNGAKGTSKGLNANILNGEYGGGGGGGRGSNSGGGFVDPATAAKYKQFMPGGENDPTRSAASLPVGANEVTGGGGKSNWQKVRERYIDNRSRMMGGSL